MSSSPSVATCASHAFFRLSPPCALCARARPRAHPSIPSRASYVLNLPLDFVNEELVELFSPYGTVMHACILAILDSCGRRRAFILMSAGEEAKKSDLSLRRRRRALYADSWSTRRAMTALNGATIRLHTLDVSYAVVQKSQVPGEDLTFFLGPPSRKD